MSLKRSWGLSSESSRFWRRCLIGNPLFLWRVLKQRLGILRFSGQ